MRARDNPFAVSRVLSVRYRLDGETWEDLLARLDQLNNRAAIVGAHGSGKTTLLEDLEPRLQTAGYRTHWLRLSEERTSLPSGWCRSFWTQLSKHDFILLDGAEQLSGWAWRRFLRQSEQAGGLLVTGWPGSSCCLPD